MIEFTPKKAVIIRDTAVISDLHLGLENVMVERGVAVPRMQVVEIVKNVRELVEEYGIERLVVAGDLKHEFSKNLPYEWEDVETFIRSVDVELVVVRGNHDNYLATILSKYGIELVESYEVHGWKIVHGHKECNAAKIVMGHEHPVVRVRYEGTVYTFPCFLKIKDIVVLPAFSPLVPGSDVTECKFLSPILRDVKPDDIEVYAIDDEVIYLGTISKLRRVLERKRF